MHKIFKAWRSLNSFQKTLAIVVSTWYIGFFAYGDPDLYLEATLVGMGLFLAWGFLQDRLEKRRKERERNPDHFPLELHDI